VAAQWSAYLGPLPLVLAWFGLRGLPRRKATFLAALAVLGIVLAFGSYTPLYWLVARTPLLAYFREPSRFLLWSVLAVALLAAAGLDRALDEALRPRRRTAIVAALCLALLALGLAGASLGLRLFEPRLRFSLQMRALAGMRPRDYPAAHYLATADASWNQVLRSVNPARPETLVPLLALAGAVWWWGWVCFSGGGFPWPAERRAVNDPASAEHSTLKGAVDGPRTQRALQRPALLASRRLEPPAFARTSTNVLLKGWGHSRARWLAPSAVALTALPLLLYGQVRLPAIPASAVEEAPPVASVSTIAGSGPPDGGAAPQEGNASAAPAPAPRVYTWLPLAADNELRLQTQAADRPADVASYRLLKRALAPNFGIDFAAPQLDGYENLLSREQALLLAALGSERSPDTSDLSLSPLFIGERRQRFGERWPLALASGVGLVLSSEQFQPLTWPAAVRYQLGVVPGAGGLPPLNGFQVAHPVPRAYVTTDWSPAASAEDAVRALISRGRSDEGMPAVITDPASALAGVRGRPPGSAATSGGQAAQFEARIVDYQERRVEIETVADREAMLVLLDAYAPGWTATVTGAPAPILPANVAFRAVPVPAGRQRVVFSYTPPYWRPAVATTTVAIITVALWLAWAAAAPVALGRRATR
jgi:hypothetical protein